MRYAVTCDEFEQEPCSDEPFMEELRNLDIFDSVRVVPPDPTSAAVGVRGDSGFLICYGTVVSIRI